MAEMALSTVTKVKLTPMTTGSFEPTRQMGYSWIRVAIPATNMAFCKSIPSCAGVRGVLDAPAMMVMGARFDTNMARICCSPKGIAFVIGTLQPVYVVDAAVRCIYCCFRCIPHNFYCLHFLYDGKRGCISPKMRPVTDLFLQLRLLVRGLIDFFHDPLHGV